MSSDFFDRISKLSPKRLALLALELHEKLEAAGYSQRAHAPVAIIGLGCRFPGGADSPEAYWRLLDEGRDAIREVPAERWDIDAWFDPDPDAPARMSVRHGGFLDRVDGFDAPFFGVSPREALTMDPQQRLALEVSWEALEHAGIAPTSLAGSASGVFLGVCNSDHFQRVIDRGDAAIDAYLASGNAHSVVSGRIAYFLGLRGPALSIDTACSSSLVALHSALHSLRSGEVRLALAGGVNVMCSPQTTIALTKAHMLAPDGRCKTFDAAADGFSRGEGCGVLVLKRLADAQADGDRVLAVIRGSACNQDGKSGGLTVPSGPAQEAVIRAALADAGLDPHDIDYVEAHGTGTTLGDPIEVRALGAALAAGRAAERPLHIGSVKTNFGHLESAAGVAGVMKVVLALQHARIPPHLHLQQPSPHIDWTQHPLHIAAEGHPWPRGPVPRRAGVSSFGFSGTNAHVVIEEAPAEQEAAASAPNAAAQPAPPPGTLRVLPLSARTPAALAALARAYVARLQATETLDEPAALAAWADIAHSAGVGRTHFTERLAVVAADAATARTALQAWLAKCPSGEPGAAPADGLGHEALHQGQAEPGQATEFAFLYTGQGSQYPGMAARLYALAPAFREVIDQCDEWLGADAQGRRLKTVMPAPAAEGAAAPIHDTAWTQPALFALELGLTALWRRWGVAPAAAIGHSVGEYAAAAAAGVFDLREGLALIAERGRLMQQLPAGGAMASLYMPVEDAEAALRDAAKSALRNAAQAAPHDAVSIAAYNAPDNVAVAGSSAAIDALLARLAARDVQGQKVHVALAAHSPQVEPALAGLQAAAAATPMRAPVIPMAWNVTGGALPGGANTPDATYWRRHLREPVRFGDGLRHLHAQGFRHFIEVGPHPTLSALAERNLPEGEVRCIGSLRRGKDDWAELMHALAEAYVHGAAVQWAEVNAPLAARRTDLPTYPFERQTFWIEADPQRAARSTAATGVAAAASAPLADAPSASTASVAAPARPSATAALHPRRLPTAVPTFEWHLGPEAPPYLAQHRVHGVPLVAGPVMVEMLARAAQAAWGRLPQSVLQFEVHAPLVLGSAGRLVQLHFGPADDSGTRFELHSRAMPPDAPPVAAPPGDDRIDKWTRHASGIVRLEAAAATPWPVLPVAQRAKDLGAPAPCGGYYERLRRLGIDLGPVFASLLEAHRRSNEVLARLQLADAAAGDPVGLAHPGLLDGALQAVGLALPAPAGEHEAHVYLFGGWQELQLSSTPLPPTLWCHARLRAGGAGDVHAHVNGQASGHARGQANGHTGKHVNGAATPGEAVAPQTWLADVTLHDEQGTCLGRIEGVQLRRAARETLQRIVAPVRSEDDAAAAAQLAYHVEWEPTPLPAATQLVPPAASASALAERFEALAREHGLGIYDALLPELDRLAAAHVVQAFGELGFDDTPGRRFIVEAEATALSIVPAHRRLFARLLRMLAEDGVLAACHAADVGAANAGNGTRFECRQRLSPIEPAALQARYESLLARFAPVDGELLTLRRCGSALARVLRGEQDALQLLFPGGSFTEARKLYVESPYARTYNGALAEALRAALAQLPADAKLRVLEIGAGTGGTTTYVLPLLPAARTDYLFTDLSPLFLERAAEQFAAWPFVRRQLLDIERDPMAQGLAPAQFDIVIAANVLHACADLGRAVAHARSLLAPGGQLLLLEGMAPERWVDLSFGLTDGWWRFTDTTLRTDYPLVDRSQWQALLAQQGYADVAVVPATGASAGSRLADAPPAARSPASHGAREQQALIVARAAVQPRHWHLVGGESPAVQALRQAFARQLAARGDRVSLSPAEMPDEATCGVAVEAVYFGALDLAEVDAPSAGAASGAEAAGEAAERCEQAAFLQPLELLARAALASAPSAASPGRVWLVTRGVHTVGNEAAAASGRWMAPLWGLGRVFALEHPQAWGGLVDLPASTTPDTGASPEAEAALLLRTFEAGDDEDQLAWRGGVRHAARLRAGMATVAATASLTQGAGPAADAGMPQLAGQGSVLVTGAFGGLGQVLSQWLADQGVRHLVLVGRRPDPQAPFIVALRARGVQVLAAAGDVADFAWVQGLPQQVAQAGLPPLAGVFHLAAQLHASPVATLQAADARRMLRPKLRGTLALQALAQAGQVPWVVLYSTSTALLGAAGLAHYAAANAFLDATASAAAVAGAAAPRILSVNWGTWEAMRLASADAQRGYVDAGLLPMPNGVALAALRALMARGAGQAMIAAVDWPQLKAVHETRRTRPLLRHVGHVPADPAARAEAAGTAGSTQKAHGAATPASTPRGSNAAGASWAQRLAGSPLAARRDRLVDLIQREVTSVLGLPAGSTVALNTGLFDLGMDSLMAVELRRRLERGAGKPLPSTLTFNYPNVGALAGFLENQLADALAQLAASARPATGPAANAGRPGAANAANAAKAAAPSTATDSAWSAAARTSTAGSGADVADAALDTLSEDELEARLLAALEKAR
ncbi:MAG: SDR family NAD(P)-dependent oxidoreductase [Rubrivivax sp.]|nr:SDR family NAD(P)-dependent oxidoreductase [Rubrivivax sp.]